MIFESRAHPVTGEPAMQYVDWNATDVPERSSTTLGVPGRPLRRFTVCADRIEIVVEHSFESGHAWILEEHAREVLRRDDPETLPALERRFGAEAEAAIAQAFAVLDRSP